MKMRDMILPLLAALFLLMPCSLLFSQQSADDEIPSWILMERGKAAFDDGDLGIALFYFQETLKRKDLTAEGYTWSGRVYEAEGEWALAENSYRNAIAGERSFYIWEDRFTPRNLLAGVLEKQGREDEAVEVYMDIIAMNCESDPANLPAFFLLEQYRVKAEGPDKFLELYRPAGAQTIRARSALGAIFLEQGELEKAMENLLLSVMVPLSMTAEIILSREPGYRFIEGPYGYTNTLRLLKKAEGDEELSRFLTDVNLYKNLYNFAIALKQNGDKQRARELVLMLTDLNDAGRWRLLAEEELAGL